MIHDTKTRRHATWIYAQVYKEAIHTLQNLQEQFPRMNVSEITLACSELVSQGLLLVEFHVKGKVFYDLKSMPKETRIEDVTPYYNFSKVPN